MNEQSRIIGAPRGADPLDSPVAAGLRPREGKGCPLESGAPAREREEDGKTSLALGNMRGLLILILLGFHSVLAYLGFLGPAAFSFDEAPYGWRAFPIVDSQRWYGFDFFCAWVDVYLMSLMFFLSALFTWPSLARKGSGKFLGDRLLRLGAPFVFGVLVVAPVALYPAYRVMASDPSPAAYVRHLLALPFWPNGPAWFLWLLMAFTIAAVGVRRFAPRWIAYLGALSSRAAARPGRYFIGLAATAALAYVPLAVAFTPWEWVERGPLSLQLSRPLLYAVYYFAGLGVGAAGIERGLLAVGGALARRWRLWLASALGCLGLWMGLTSLTFPDAAAAPLIVQIGADASFALAGASGCFSVLAVSLRFGAVRSPLFGRLSNNAFGIYLLHFIPVVWLQYALLAAPTFAFLKAAIVFGGALAVSWSATEAIRFSRLGARFIGEAPGPAAQRTNAAPIGLRAFARRARRRSAPASSGDKGKMESDFAMRAAGPGEQEPIR